MVLDMFTIRGAGERSSSGSIALVTRSAPYTFVSITVRSASTSSIVGSCTPSSTRPAIPAVAAAPALRTEVTSSATPNASTPSARRPCTAASRRSSSRAPTATRNPVAPRPRAIARPIPLFAPVTSATLLSVIEFSAM